MRDDRHWYFAYGSNMSPAIFVEQRQMQPLDSRIGYVDDHRLCFDLPVGSGERGVANLRQHSGARTWGVIYRISNEDFARLDNSEGVAAGYYDRVAITVVSDTQTIAALTYQSRHSVAGRKPSARYLGLLLDGAQHHRLPTDYVELLKTFELGVDERLSG